MQKQLNSVRLSACHVLLLAYMFILRVLDRGGGSSCGITPTLIVSQEDDGTIMEKTKKKKVVVVVVEVL